MRRGFCRRSDDAFEQENKWYAAEREQAKQPEIVHKRPQMRLSVERLVQDAVSLPGRGDGIGMPRERVLRGGQLLRERRISRRQVIHH